MAKTNNATVTADKVVELRMKMTNDTGEVLDQTSDDEPLTYLHGHENLVPGLEAALEGHHAGDRVQVTVPPEDAYGDHDGSEPEAIPRADLPNDIELEPGMELEAELDDGSLEVVWITHIDGDQVYVDANHPLAGETLHFDVEVLSIRDGTSEEIVHGHPHPPDDSEHLH